MAAVLLTGIILCMSACGGNDRTSASKLNDSGDGYLSESDHEEAVAETVSEALMGYLAEMEPEQAEETEEITEAGFPIQSEEDPED